MDRLQLLLQHLKAGKTAGAGQAHVGDLVLAEDCEEGFCEVLEVGLGGQLVLGEEVGEGGAELQAELAVLAGGAGDGAGVGVGEEA